MEREYQKMVLAKPRYPKFATVWASIDGVPTCVMLGNSIPIPGGHVFYYLVGYKGLREETYIYPTVEELEKVPRSMREPAKPRRIPGDPSHAPAMMKTGSARRGERSVK